MQYNKKIIIIEIHMVPASNQVLTIHKPLKNAVNLSDIDEPIIRERARTRTWCSENRLPNCMLWYKPNELYVPRS